MIAPNWAFAPRKRFNGSRRGGVEFGNVYSPEVYSPETVPFSGTKRSKKIFSQKFAKIRDLYKQGKLSQLDALRILRADYGMGLRDAVLCLQGRLEQ